MRGKWGVELAEMSAFKKSDEEARKAFFSTPADDFRPPYGRANIEVLRRCVLFGTTDDKQYLSDHRGNRRYWPIHFPARWI
jgi:predicted P-loop ATPase